MTRALLGLLVLVLALAVLPARTCSAAAPTLATAGAPRPISRTLGNGLRISVIEDHAAAVVQTAMWYRFGSLDERFGKTGLAHGLEHMMFRGTNALSGGGLDDIGARLGAVINANTTEDYTHFYFTLPADRMDLALHIEADRMRGLLLRSGDWTLEKGAVLAEYDGDAGQPVFKLTQAVREAAYRGSPYARGALGVRADVVASRPADLRRYYDTYYRPNNATLVVTGDVKAADVFGTAQRYFGSIPSKPLPVRPRLALPDASDGKTLTLTSDDPSTLVDCAYRIPGDLDADAAATQVFANLIENPRSAVYRNLVLSHLVLGYDAYADTSLHAGIFHVVFSVRPGVAASRVRHVFDATIAHMAATGVDAQLLMAAKTASARQVVYARDSISGLGDRYGYALGVEEHDPAVDDRAVEALDLAAMNAAVKRYFGRESVVGTLVPRVTPSSGVADVQSISPINDDFSKRPPSGPIVLAPWARAGVERPLRLASRIAPRVFHLTNGLRLYVQPVHENPTVFVSGNIDVSPAFDPPGKTGLGGLTAELLQYGSQRYDYAAVQRIGDELGADIHFGFQFGAHGLARDLGRLLDIVADGERRPIFPARYVELARDAELASVMQGKQSPDAGAERAFLRAVYPPGDPILREESADSLHAITLRDLRSYAARYIRPDRTTIVVAGDVDPATVREQVTRAFGDWRNVGTLRAIRPLPLPRTQAAVRYIATTRDTVNVRLGQRAVGRLDPDFYAFNLINSVLGADGTFDTRLMHDIRETRGLVYDVSSALSVARERGTLEISLSAAPSNVGPAVRLVQANLRRLRSEPIAPDELVRARTKIVAGALVSEEATPALVGGCELIARYNFSANYYRTLTARYARYNPADLLHVARRYIQPDELVQVYEGPMPTYTGTHSPTTRRYVPHLAKTRRSAQRSSAVASPRA